MVTVILRDMKDFIKISGGRCYENFIENIAIGVMVCYD